MSERVVSFLTAHPLQTARRETAGADEPLDISAKPASRWCLLRGRFSRISDSATRLALISFGAVLADLGQVFRGVAVGGWPQLNHRLSGAFGAVLADLGQVFRGVAVGPS